VAIDTGYSHACAIDETGAVWCWGAQPGQDGQTPVPGPTPQRVNGVDHAVELALGAFHTCVRDAAGSVFCLGYNIYGQVGRGDFAFVVPNLTRVEGLDPVQRIVATKHHTCAITKRPEAALFCWGSNSRGQIGDGTYDDHPRPVQVMVGGAPLVLDVATGYESTCVVWIDGSVFCWGNNEGGQLGDGTRLDHTTPAPAQYQAPDGSTGPMTRASQVYSTSNSGACARRDDGIYCWGANDAGELALGPNVPTNAYYLIGKRTILPPIVQVLALGEDSGCAYAAPSDGIPSVQCFGLAVLDGQGLVPGTAQDNELPKVLTPKPVVWPDPLK
jgi:alpha-tubulin suppressor-like RCC1 family protein